MDEKCEGLAFPPLPVGDPRVRRARRGPLVSSAAGALPCVVCGAPVVEHHSKRICLRCGFMAGCPEGVERA